MSPFLIVLGSLLHPMTGVWGQVDDPSMRERRVDVPGMYAVVIGVGRYRDKQVDAVPYGVEDAQAMAGYFVEQMGVPQSHVLVLQQESATKTGIEEALVQWLPSHTDGESTVFVYYAGLGTLEPVTGEASLIPWNGHPDRAGTLLPLKEVYQTLELSGARRVMLLLDTCFASTGGRCVSPPAKRALVPASGMPSGLRPAANVVTLMAGNGRQTSLDYDRARHGLFTHYLLTGLYGEADADQNGTVTLGELYRYVREQVSETAWSTFFRLQTPAWIINDQIEPSPEGWVVARADRNALARRHRKAGEALHQQGNLEGALAEYRTAVRLAPDDAQAHLRLGLALRDKGDIDGAVVSYQMTLHLRPNDPDAHYLLGTAYSEKGRLEAATQEFLQAIKLKPGFDVAHNNLGHVLEQKGDLDGAIAQYRIAAKLQPRDARAHYNLGSALKDRGDLAGAVKELREAVKLKPDYVKAYYHLGVALAVQGRREDGAKALRRFIELSPGTPENRAMVQDAKTRLKALE